MFTGTAVERVYVEKVNITNPLPRQLQPNLTMPQVALFERRAPMKGYLLLGCLYIASRFVSLYSLNLIDFRTHVMWKNAKLPVTMIVRSCILSGVSYSARSYLIACIFVLSLVFFTVGSNAVSPTFDVIGIPIVMLSLGVDALLANIQEQQMKEHEASTSEVMLQSSGLAFVIGLVMNITSLGPTIAYLWSAPATFLWIVAATTLCFFGMKAIMLLMENQGTVVVSTVTSLRKVFTVLLSFLTMGHAQFHKNHAVGMCFLVLGMGLHTNEQRLAETQSAAGLSNSDGKTAGSIPHLPLITNPERRHIEGASAVGEASPRSHVV